MTPLRSARRLHRVLTATSLVLVAWCIIGAVIAATQPLSRVWAVAMPLFAGAIVALIPALSKIAYRWQCLYHELNHEHDLYEEFREWLDAQ